MRDMHERVKSQTDSQIALDESCILAILRSFSLSSEIVILCSHYISIERFILIFTHLKQTKKMVNCCSIIRSELSPCQQDFFASVDVNGRRLDMEASFGPSSVPAVLAKAALAGFVFYTWISMFLAADDRGFFFAYLTNWMVSLQVIYHIFSLWNSFSPPPRVNARIKFTWLLYNMVTHSDCVVVLLYWLTVFDPEETELTFNRISPHGLTLAVALVEGMVVNRIPLRLYHWYAAAMPIGAIYIAWTVVHAFADIGNPNKSSDGDETTNDEDLLYPAVDWRNDTVTTLIFMMANLFIVGPILQLVLFTLSLYSPWCRTSRRYLPEDEGDVKNQKGATTNETDEEMYAVAY